MASVRDSQKILAEIADDRVLALEQALIRIPSSSFQEGEIADYLANYMSDFGLEVEMMDVPSPRDPTVVSRQPVGRLAGSGGGASGTFRSSRIRTRFPEISTSLILMTDIQKLLRPRR